MTRDHDSHTATQPPISGILDVLPRPFCPPIGADMGGKIQP